MSTCAQAPEDLNGQPRAGGHSVCNMANDVGDEDMIPDSDLGGDLLWANVYNISEEG